MLGLLTKAFKKTIERLREELVSAPLDRWTEAVFRFYFCQTLSLLSMGTRQLVECNKIDLVLCGEDKTAFVEFKFYKHSSVYDPYTGVQTRGRKGFPSPGNWNNFTDCVNKLRERPAPANLYKVVVLFYADPVGMRGRTHESYYGDAAALEQKLHIKLLSSVPSFDCANSSIKCCAAMYEVAGPNFALNADGRKRAFTQQRHDQRRRTDLRHLASRDRRSP